MNESSPGRAGRVVVGVDGSEYSTAALRMAGRMAAALGAPLTAVTCWSLSDFYISGYLPVGNDAMKNQLEDEARRQVDLALERAFGEDRPEHLDVDVRYGSTAKILIEESRGAQLLVVGRRGSGGFLGQTIGSVSAACAAHAHCPVLVVGGDQSEGD